MEYDFSAISYEELKKMEAAINAEKIRREDVHFNELVATLCNAFNELKKEFPTVRLDIDVECPDCEVVDDLDLMEYFCNGLKPADFCR